jgi:lysozyme family protein
MDFNEAFEKLIGHEGGYVNNPKDPGGETKFGVSKREYPKEDIPGLTIDRAKAIYMRDYWLPAGCEALPDSAKFQVFDMAVNSGVSRAVMCLQDASGTHQDGVLGPVTLRAIQSIPGPRLVARFNAARLDFITGLDTWAAFGKGWARRIAKNLRDA